MNEIFKEIKILSGGQTGVDRAVLDFAIKNNIEYGGWCPFGRLAEDGILAEKYVLKESNTKLYIHRTFLNVRDSDATLIFFVNKLDIGTARNIAFCKVLNKTFLLINLTDPYIHNIILNFIIEKSNYIINFAGPIESSSPGIYNLTSKVLNKTF